MRKRPLGNEVSNFVLEPTQDARLSLAHSGGGDTEIGSDVRNGVAINRRPPERLPGATFKFRLDQFQSSVEQLRHQGRRVIVVAVVDSWNLAEHTFCIGAADSRGAGSAR